MGLIPGLGRSPGEGNGNPLQYSCLGNLTDRGAWWATVHAVTESDMTEHLTQRDMCFTINGVLYLRICGPSLMSSWNITLG